MTKKRSAVALLVSLCFGGVGCVQAKPDLTASMSLNGRLRYTTETFLGPARYPTTQQTYT